MEPIYSPAAVYPINRYISRSFRPFEPVPPSSDLEIVDDLIPSTSVDDSSTSVDDSSTVDDSIPSLATSSQLPTPSPMIPDDHLLLFYYRVLPIPVERDIVCSLQIPVERDIVCSARLPLDVLRRFPQIAFLQRTVFQPTQRLEASRRISTGAIQSHVEFYERTGMIVPAILDSAGITNTDVSNEILTSLLAEIYLQNTKLTYETVGDAIIGSLEATPVAVSAMITGTQSIPNLVASFVTNRRFFSLFQTQTSMFQRLLSSGSEGDLKGKEFADKVESTIFAIFETLRLCNTETGSWADVSTRRLRGVLEYLKVLSRDDQFPQLRQALPPFIDTSSKVKACLADFGLGGTFLPKNMLFLSHALNDLPKQSRSPFVAGLREIGLQTMQQVFVLYAYYGNQEQPAGTE